MNVRMALTRFAFCFGSSLTGCASQLPQWANNPPKDSYVGVSGCVPSSAYGEMLAFTNALRRKCGATSGRIELINFTPPFTEVTYDKCAGGLEVYALFGANDLNCSLITPY